MDNPPTTPISPDTLRLLVDDGPMLPWTARWEAESPFLQKILGEAPSRRVLDLGCGTGEHARALAAEGFDVTAVDASRPKLDQAEAAWAEKSGAAAGGESGAEPVSEPDWIQGEMGAVEALVRGQFGAALLLGNTLAHVIGTESLSRMMIGLRRRLRPKAPILVHLYNYERIYRRGQRELPVRKVVGPEGEPWLGLRLLDPREDGFVVMTASLLDCDPQRDDAVRSLGAYSQHLRPWRLEEIEAVLSVAQFGVQAAYGGFDGRPFDRERCEELLLVAR